ncbi:hypothetical protein T484DRAFT_1770293 [Baffinella frigidus]|nr:hypothetical protein T484DRAFT_1770293 [Cryptophyta sp. CCMP2293]
MNSYSDPYQLYKKHIPLTYDFLTNHNLAHTSPCVCWGKVLRDTDEFTTQRIACHQPSEADHTEAGACANSSGGWVVGEKEERIFYAKGGRNQGDGRSIVVADAKVDKELVADADEMASFGEDEPSDKIRERHWIPMPENSDLNRMATVGAKNHLLVAKSDHQFLHIWDLTDLQRSNLV